MPTVTQLQPLGAIEEASLDAFDIDAEVTVEAAATSPLITSISLCTPGCTSPGGGSGCSFCC